MDAVGDLLAQRQEDRFPWSGAALLAFLLHAGILAGFLLSAIAKPARYSRPRAVAVRLLQAGSIRTAEPVRAALAPPAAVERPKIEKPPEEAPPPPSKKAVLLPAKESAKKPTPVSRPGKSTGPAVSLPSAGEESATASGPAAGAGGTASIGGFKIDQADFKYPYYIEQMTNILSVQWGLTPKQSTTTKPVVHFQIERDGTIVDARVVVSSGVPFVDRNAVRAVLTSSPLPPLPAEYSGPHLGIQVVFD